MKIEELTLTISDKTGVEPPAVQKVLEATFALLGERLGKEGKVDLRGLGTFVRKQSRKSDKREKTLFKSWSEKGAKGKKRAVTKSHKKTRRKTRKTKKGSSP